MGVAGSNGIEARGSSYRITEIVDKVEGKEAEGRFVAEGGISQSTPASGDTTDK